jgi:hypothetical protein
MLYIVNIIMFNLYYILFPTSARLQTITGSATIISMIVHLEWLESNFEISCTGAGIYHQKKEQTIEMGLTVSQEYNL